MPDTLPIPQVSDDMLLRRAALEAAHADGELRQWDHFSVMTGHRRAWVAQDDYLPAPGQDDPIPREWREVLALLWKLGYGDVGSPLYDTITGTWLWVVER